MSSFKDMMLGILSERKFAKKSKPERKSKWEGKEGSSKWEEKYRKIYLFVKGIDDGLAHQAGSKEELKLAKQILERILDRIEKEKKK